MSVECVKCSGRAQTYLCVQCITWLRRELLGMPTLIGYLNDMAIADTRLSNEQSRALGFESRTHSFDDRATALIEEIDATLYRWAMRLVWRHRYVISPPVNWHRPDLSYTHTSTDYATFLAAHTADLANDEYVGELCTKLREYVGRAVGGREEGGLLNRRTPEVFCGPCSATINDHRRCVDEAGVSTCSRIPHTCATRLMSRRGALEVTCPRCGAVHRVQKLIEHLLASAPDYRGTIPELYRVLRMLNEPVAMDTLYRWAEPPNGKRRGSGQLKPTGYQREDGRIGVTKRSDKDKPMYRVSDVRNTREKSMKPGRRGRPLGRKVKGDKGNE